MVKVKEVLGYGRNEAKTGRQLAVLLGVSTRDICSMVQYERRNGVPICSTTGSPAGYYLAATKQEIDYCCAELFTKGGEIMKTRRALMQIRDSLPDDETTENRGRVPDCCPVSVLPDNQQSVSN
ncbi:MAG: hypothetical protein K6B72_02450 [Lachnospiraceae bacterium]|nr:hypothetical protein [Lachnospiraceae bacterium]